MAKKRIWSTIGPISSPRWTAYGLPVFSLSRCMISSARASIASAIRNSASERSDGVLSRQSSNAVAAACIARSTSAGPDNVASAYCSPVAGLITGDVRPSLASTHSPLTKFLKAFMAARCSRSPPGVSGSARAFEPVIVGPPRGVAR